MQRNISEKYLLLLFLEVCFVFIARLVSFYVKVRIRKLFEHLQFSSQNIE